MTGLNEVGNDLYMETYPNPFTNSLVIETGTLIDDYTIRLIDASGRMVYELISDSNSFNGKQIVLNDLDNLEPGVYQLEVIMGESKRVSKVMKN